MLITEDMVKSMKRGSVIVDLAAEGGGNCELTEPGEAKVFHGVHVLGYTDLPSRLPTQSSRLYGNNLVKLVNLLGRSMNFQSIRKTRSSAAPWSWTRASFPASAQGRGQSATGQTQGASGTGFRGQGIRRGSSIFPPGLMLGLLAIVLLALGWKGENEFLDQLTVFVLSCFVGYMVVWNVTPSLHTPLMSVTNAISGIILVGGMLFVTGAEPWADTKGILAGMAIFLATINVAGGFLVTHRMLKMFRKE